MTEERRLAAIMFSDICSFSSIMESDEQRALSFVNMHKQCVNDGTDYHGGRIIKEMGDGLLVEFPSAVNAVRCAVEVQKAISKYNDSVEPAEQFNLRIGIHVGDVVVAGDDILGDGVNVASRIEPLAEPGGICISRDIFDLVKNKISIETVHLGAHDLKNISRQVSIYKVLLDAVGTPCKTIPPTARKKKHTLKYIAAAALLVLVLGGLAKTARKNKRAGNEKRQVVTAEKTIRERQRQFTRAMLEKDRETALSFVSPFILAKTDANMLWNKLSVMSFVAKLGRITNDDLKIKFVHISEQGKSADVVMSIRDKSAGDTDLWKDVRPSKWILIDGSWYLDFEPLKQKGKPGDQSIQKRPGFRKPPIERGSKRLRQ